MQAKAYWIGAGIALLVFVACSGFADASGVAATCSNVTFTNVGQRLWYFGAGDQPGSNTACTTGASGDTLKELTAGGSATCPASATCSITLKCREGTIGVAPSQATTLTLKLYADNTAFGSPATATQFWSANPTGNACLTEQTFTVWCTSDGTSTGSPRHGTVRLVLRAQNTGVGAYDVNTDSNGNWGIYRCNPRLSAYTDGNPSSSPSVYVGGDTIRTALTASSSVYSGSSNVRVDITCGAATNTAGTTTLVAGSAVNVDTTIKGLSTTWPDDCSLTQKAIVATTSSITGLTSEPLFKWDTGGTPPSGVTYPSSTTAQRATGKNLDRTLSASSCLVHENSGAHSAITIENRGNTVELHGTYVDARTTNVPNNQLGRAWLVTAPGRTTTAAAASDFAFDITSKASSPFTILSTAPVSTGYLQYVEEYGASRTDAELYNWGNCTPGLEISSTYTWGSINNAKGAGGSNATTFTIGAEQEFVQPKDLVTVRGVLVSGATTTCTRTNPVGVSDAPVSHGTTSAGGDATEVQYTPTAPQGEWSITCTATLNGNTGTYTILFFYTSALSSDTNVGIIPQLVTNGTGTWLNLTVDITLFGNSTLWVNHTVNDSGTPVTLSMESYNATGHHWQKILGQVMTPVQPYQAIDRSVYYTHVLLNASDLQEAWNLEVTTNISGKPFIASAGWVPSAAAGSGGGAPLRVMAVYSWDNHNALISVESRYLNGTGRSGIASLINVSLYDPSGANAPYTETVTAVDAYGNYRLNVYLGVAPALGAWFVNVTVPQPDGNGYTVTSTVFAVNENLTLRLNDIDTFLTDLQFWLGEQFAYTNVLINATRALDEANFTAIDAALADIAASLGMPANVTAPNVTFTTTGVLTGPAPGAYAGRSVKFTANATAVNTSYGPAIYMWDFGDNATAQGIIAYHTYDELGNYTVNLTVLNGLGLAGTASSVLRVNESTPIVNVSGPLAPVQWRRVVYDARASTDPYDEIVKVEWTVNPTSVDGGSILGQLQTHAGQSEGWLFNYTWLLVGNQTLRVNVTNAHGHTNTTYYRVNVTDGVGFQNLKTQYPDYGQLGNDISTNAQASVTRVQRFVQFWAWVFGGFH